MGSYPDEFPFGIMEVVNLLNCASGVNRRTASMWTARSAVSAGDG